jgi:hypothetical protein
MCGYKLFLTRKYEAFLTMNYVLFISVWITITENENIHAYKNMSLLLRIKKYSCIFNFVRGIYGK